MRVLHWLGIHDEPKLLTARMFPERGYTLQHWYCVTCERCFDRMLTLPRTFCREMILDERIRSLENSQGKWGMFGGLIDNRQLIDELKRERGLL